MPLHESSINNDTSRCMGKGCPVKEKCMRFTQVEKDIKNNRDTMLSYVNTMLDTNGECRSFILV